MSQTPVIEVKAERVVTMETGDGWALVAFKPSRTTIKALTKAENSLVAVDLIDETGEWSNGRTVAVVDLVVSDDERCVTAKLLTLI